MTRDELIKEFRAHNFAVQCFELETRHVLIDALLSIDPNESTLFLTDNFSPAEWPYMTLGTFSDGWCLCSSISSECVITPEEFLEMVGFSPAEDKLCAASLEDIL